MAWKPARGVVEVTVEPQPLVSVIVPVYNGAEFVAAALESALAQTYRNLEIIVVDDGSRDRTVAIVTDMAARDTRIRLFTQANSGVAKARNRAIAEARGELIAPLDADDLWLPRKIERQVERISTAGDACGFVYCWWAIIDEAGVVVDRSPDWQVEGRTLDALVRMNFTGNASVPLFRRQWLAEAGGYNPELAQRQSGGCEDWEVALRIAARHDVAVVPEVLMGYRRRAGSMSQACDTMKRSHDLVLAGLIDLQPDLSAAQVRQANAHFAMHLAATALSAGHAREAMRWGIQAGVALPLRLAPFVAKMLLWPRRPASNVVMRPGQAVDVERIPAARIPYHRILARMTAAQGASSPPGNRRFQ